MFQFPVLINMLQSFTTYTLYYHTLLLLLLLLIIIIISPLRLLGNLYFEVAIHLVEDPQSLVLACVICTVQPIDFHLFFPIMVYKIRHSEGRRMMREKERERDDDERRGGVNPYKVHERLVYSSSSSSSSS